MATTKPSEEMQCSKALFEEPSVPRKIKQIKFGLMAPTEIVNSAEFHVYERALYKMPERRPQPNGVLDSRLGISNKRATCETCNQTLADCTGHFGYIALELPVFHFGYFRNTLQILQCVCKSCSLVLLNEAERRYFVRKFRSNRTERVAREANFRRLLDRCKRIRICPHCGGSNGPVKKTPGSLKLIHDPFYKKPEDQRWTGMRAEYLEEFEKAAAANPELEKHLKSVVEDLNPLKVFNLFTCIPDTDCELLDLAGRPEHLIMTHLPVPPVCIRPSVEMDGGAGSNEDDLTMKLMQIVEVNNILRQGLERGLPVSTIAENWDFLQVQCALYINSDSPGTTAQYQVAGKPMRGFVQRLKGKQGRFRGNLSGKRVDFSGRTVISPNPNLSIDQVAVPKLMAMTLTFPERVTQHNLEKLQQKVLNGAASWPGANFVILKSGEKVFLKFGDRKRLAAELAIGDTVERHLEDNDIVLFNRQPSLHRMSIMAHRVRVLPWRTLRFNECVCAPYNADFDGDEMNIHVPQTEEARAEAYHLMGVTRNLCTPKNGEVLIAATQDFLTSAFLLTSKDVFLTQAQICQLAGYMTCNNVPIDLPPPAVVKPLQLWTGKQLFSLLIKPNNQTDILVTLETPEKIYAKKGNPLHMCPNDGYIYFRNSELICGRLGKGTLGGGNKAGLFGVLLADYSPSLAAECMNRLARLSARSIGDLGFSIGIDDVRPVQDLREKKANVVQDGYQKCTDFIEQYKDGKLRLSAGCNEDESLEASITGVLNAIREAAANSCMATLAKHNSPLVMSQCGSKGSPINIAQMVACVGQQSVGGKRAPDGFYHRTLPHFPRKDRTPAGKGFVQNSFYSGLTPTEFFFHTMAGREGLVDTAVKTAETGYMSRRLMKAMEDLYVHYDGSVRNAAGGVVQLRYGEDGIDPCSTEGDRAQPLEFTRLTAVVQARQSRERQLKVLEGGPSADGGAATSAAAAGGGRKKATAKGKAAAAAAAAVAAAEDFAALPSELAEVLAEVMAQEKYAVHMPKNAGGSNENADANGTAAMEVDGEDIKTETPLEDEDDTANDTPLWPEASQAAFCSKQFAHQLRDALKESIDTTIMLRTRFGLPLNERGASDAEHAVRCCGGLTLSEIRDLALKSTERYESKRIDPGSTVGAFGAQSIGEPGTQMTLKTFHFAGVASMNVTLGVPRIKEIINAARNISTPLIEVPMDGAHDDESRARLIKGRLERTTLGQVAKSMQQVVHRAEAYVEIVISQKTIEKLQLSNELNVDTVIRALRSPASKLKVKEDQVRPSKDEVNAVCVFPFSCDAKDKEKEDEKKTINSQLARLAALLPEAVVWGIPTVNRAVITRKENDQSHLYLVAEGTGLLSIMGTEGVDWRKVRSNNIMEVASCLGIEAARKTIVYEIKYTMEQHGMAIDERHTMLLADCMTYKGEVLGITRFGIAKMKDSVLMLASFEKTTDHLFDAALHGRVDEVTGVSESIIMGIPMPTGTGLFKVQQTKHVKNLTRRPPPLLVGI